MERYVDYIRFRVSLSIIAKTNNFLEEFKMYKKTQKAIVCAATCFLMAGSISFASLNVNVSGKESIQVDFGLVNVIEEPGGDIVLQSDQSQYLSKSGEPRIPWKVFTLLLPADVDLQSVSCKAESLTFKSVEGKYSVKPQPPVATWDEKGKTRIVWPEGKEIVDGRDVSIYRTDKLWPKECVRLLRAGKLRNWKVAEIAVALARCNSLKGGLEVMSHAELAIDFKIVKGNTKNNPVKMAGRVRQLVCNFEQFADEYDTTTAGEDSTGYTIITTSAISGASTKLADFSAHKQNQGFIVQVITEDEFGGGQGNEAADNIRAWLQTNYLTDDIKYVLLIGNPHPTVGYVPMKFTTGEDQPTDYYYADLSGDWDLNGNGIYGDEGDIGSGGIDRYWEVLVGRIPYYNSIEQVDLILQKAIDYELSQDSFSWRKKVLLPMVAFDKQTLCYQLGEQIRHYLLEPESMPSHRIYEDYYDLDPPAETIPCTYETVTDVWSNEPFGLIVWQTHGSAHSAADIMSNDYLGELNDSYPTATWQGSCLNSEPEYTDNMSYELLKHGAIVTVGATRVSWYWIGETYFVYSSSIGGMGYQYASHVVDHLSCGQALYDTKQYIPSNLWDNHLVFNMYGDPSIIVCAPDPDVYPPLPDPMMWDVGPYATGTGSIAMAAAKAVDENSVEYYFECVSYGGHDSGWQTSRFYEDMRLRPDTEYTYRVKARDLSGNLNETALSKAGTALTEAFTTTVIVYDVVMEDVPIEAIVEGDYRNTWKDDDNYETLTEVESGGNPIKDHYSYLEHKWVIEVFGGDKLIFNVQAYHTANSEDDDFIFAYSLDDVNYTNMVTVTKTSDDNNSQSFELPNDLGGPIFIRVKDTDQTATHMNRDTLYIDDMYVVSMHQINGSDGMVGFSILAENWLREGCDFCGGADITDDGNVNIMDLAEFVAGWF